VGGEPYQYRRALVAVLLAYLFHHGDRGLHRVPGLVHGGEATSVSIVFVLPAVVTLQHAAADLRPSPHTAAEDRPHNGTAYRAEDRSLHLPARVLAHDVSNLVADNKGKPRLGVGILLHGVPQPDHHVNAPVRQGNRVDLLVPLLVLAAEHLGGLQRGPDNRRQLANNPVKGFVGDPALLGVAAYDTVLPLKYLADVLSLARS